MRRKERDSWNKISTSLIKKINNNKGAKFFIRNNSSFENWIQVELVGLLIGEFCGNIEIEKEENNNADIKCDGKCIEVKISGKKCRGVAGKENSILSDLLKKTTGYVVALGLDLEGSDWSRKHFVKENNEWKFIPTEEPYKCDFVTYNEFQIENMKCAVVVIKNKDEYSGNKEGE
ncbi:MAG: hypothetical protein KAJ18_06460 [Candidatus Omnitrophica bacterium]|nr:hypothetical protein [Candidatus Omnitrophota bacterium]